MASNNFVKTVNNVDIFTQRYPQADMAKHLSSTSQWDPDSSQPDEYLRMEGRMGRVEMQNQWTNSTGLTHTSTLTKVFFMYLGGMYVARKQFIFNTLYFRNSKFNWIMGGKYIFLGYLFGSCVAALNWGKPYNIEDLLRSFFRQFTTFKYFDMAIRPGY